MATRGEELRLAGWGDGEAVAGIGEGEMLRRLIELSSPAAGDGLLPAGDDAAGWRPEPGAMVCWSVDVLSEEVDFRRRYWSPYQVGWKAWMAAVSDLAAMGATPRYGLVAAQVPPGATERELLAIELGLVEAAAVDGAVIAGGDLGATPGPLSLSVTVAGEVTAGEEPVRLSGARVGDRLLLTGRIGRAAAALRRLEAGEVPAGQEWADPLLQPQSRVGLGRELRRSGASAMTDLSDGLLLDLERLCQASGVGAELWLDRLLAVTPSAPDQRLLYLAGGEDLELLAAVPEEGIRPLLARWSGRLPQLTEVGCIRAGEGTALLAAPGGERLELPEDHGFRHF